MASGSLSGPTLRFAYRGHALQVTRHPEHRFGDVIPWCVTVDGGCYFVGGDAHMAIDDARKFFNARLPDPSVPRSPAQLASRRFPLMLMVDGAAVRAWPTFLPRETGSATYVQPATGDRVATTKGPMWVFTGGGRMPSPSGTVTLEQTLDDVVDLAKVWLRSADA